MKLTIPISERSRQFGYIYWSKNLDNEVNNMLHDMNYVTVIFNGDNLGEKHIDWKYRRISVGWRRTRALESKYKSFELSLSSNNILKVICKP